MFVNFRIKFCPLGSGTYILRQVDFFNELETIRPSVVTTFDSNSIAICDQPISNLMPFKAIHLLTSKISMVHFYYATRLKMNFIKHRCECRQLHG
jgi:hypothetical protein